MSIRISAFTIEIGDSKSLSVAQGEDREFRLTFTENGTARDMTGATAIVLTVRSRTNGLEILSRSYSGFQGAASAGTPRFQILAADTASQGAGPYDCWVEWTDGSGYVEQLLAESTFEILTGADATTVTTPPAVPVVYGINWGWASGLSPFWTGKSGGYNTNDGVQAYDGSLGATAISTFRAVSQGVTAYPVTGSSALVASGWAYIGQHGGAGGGGGSAQTNTAVKTSGYTATYDDRVLCNAGGSTFYVQLPTTSANRIVEVATINDNGTITVRAVSGEWVAGSSGFELDGIASARFVGDGSTGWMVF